MTKYSDLVLAKLRAGLATQDNYIFNTNYEGNAAGGSVKIPVRNTEVTVSDYNSAEGLEGTPAGTTYLTLAIDNDKAVNEIIDGYDAASVPDNIIAERLDSAGYSMGLTIDKQSIGLLESMGTEAVDTEQSAANDIYTKIVAARTTLSEAHVPTQDRWLIVSPETYGKLLLSTEFIREGDLSQELVESGAVGKVAGFAVYESSALAEDTEFVAGHPNWCHRVMDWKVEPTICDLNGSANYVGASAVKGRMVYGLTISKPETVYVKKFGEQV
ncbi:MAG: hypothetical protein PHE51_05490 [Eubacteriales bacterium]|nr:hypothetical protein [Eubacteriales bacterium]